MQPRVVMRGEQRRTAKSTGKGKGEEESSAIHSPGGCLSMEGIDHPGYHRSNRFAKVCVQAGVGWGELRTFPIKKNTFYILVQ